MIKENIEYIDYNGVKRAEDFYFHLSEAEIMEMEMSTSGGMSEMLERIVSAQDTPSLVKVFKEIILKSYGEKSPDGRKFVKSKALSDGFSHTEAYSKLFMKLSTDSDAASRFMNGIIKSSIPDKPAEKLQITSASGPEPLNE